MSVTAELVHRQEVSPIQILPTLTRIIVFLTK